ncbi:aminopeptidase N [Paroceanicella profunda]|uniref:Aminopeptidase N n=1 Tax=Paroceanicella profunda TaxID=2579971 RepID=A0A5B8FHX8_9RHOB|nr:aminopeptidase N [Paroceanicella profunda]QDL92717.1 aminopeptidase N [Paroceanicella profunda]
MRDAMHGAVRLTDYAPAAWTVEHVALTFALDPHATRVTARIRFRPNPDAAPGQGLWLDGEQLELVSATIDGTPVSPEVSAEGLSLPASALPAGGFDWEAVTVIDPASNTSLDGLYMSNGMYCTQCEAQGFRKITYYPDRPDVMARFHVRIEGDQRVKLSNGNPVASGAGWAEWDDPWPKPSYLFALVAGDLLSHDDSFTTASGREVALKIYVRPGDEDRCAYAMDALKRSMDWDERAYGREYDLDLFMIVAVDDFNMGAMENKGLNIFNSKYVLASPDTATDRDYELIEGIIAHEYFHNWTGNRITCRDWFQLCLKEGLTVFRDQCFSADQRSEPVKRIADVLQLRARQFREDAGPLAHPVRPTEYVEINNFYTATVYEKGAEVIRMLRLMVGDAAYRQALDLYFERHDGEACTIEDWLKVFEDATGRDLSQFALWYSQAGTPRVAAQVDYTGGTLTLTLTQEVPPTPGQPVKAPMVIPVATGFLAPDGSDAAPAQVLELTAARQVFTFEMPERLVVSLLRGFSAPVILEMARTPAERAFLIAHDSDPFNRWEAARNLATDTALAMAADPDLPADPALVAALATLAADESVDPAFRALALTLPSREALAQESFQRGTAADPDAIERALTDLATAVATGGAEVFNDLYDRYATPGAYCPEAGDAARRALRATALGYITRLDPRGIAAGTLFGAATNMTESLSALSLLVREDAPSATAALATFYERWKADRLVIDKWFTLQAMASPSGVALERARQLAGHADFDWKNPNRFRALIGGFAANPTAFHRADGAGYRFVADWLLKLDPLNPQTTARMAGCFETWARYEPGRQALIRAELERMAAEPGLSKNTREIVERILGA